jgi:hypothetical protein
LRPLPAALFADLARGFTATVAFSPATLLAIYFLAGKGDRRRAQYRKCHGQGREPRRLFPTRSGHGRPSN